MFLLRRPLTVKQEVRTAGDQYSTRRHEELEGTMKYDLFSKHYGVVTVPSVSATPKASPR